MNATLKRHLTVIGLGVVLAAGLPATGAASPGSAVVHTWEFESDANPASNTGPDAKAVIEWDREFGSGWISGDPSLGAANGVWDLGRSGRISLTDSSGLTGSPQAARRIKVKVVQWMDGTIFNTPVDVSVPGATKSSETGHIGQVGLIGEWVERNSEWLASEGSTVESIVVTGPSNGAMVDKVTVEALPVGPEPVPLSIRSAGAGTSAVVLSWITTESGWLIEANPDVTNPDSWVELGVPVTVQGNLHSALVDSAGAARFFRLKRP